MQRRNQTPPPARRSTSRNWYALSAPSIVVQLTWLSSPTWSAPPAVPPPAAVPQALMEILLVRCQAAAPWQGCIQPRPQQQQRAYLFEVESLGLLSGGSTPASALCWRHHLLHRSWHCVFHSSSCTMRDGHHWRSELATCAHWRGWTRWRDAWLGRG